MTSRLPRIGIALLMLGAGASLVVSAQLGGIDAEVAEKATDANGAYVVARTDVGGFEFQRYLPTQEWMVVQEGDEVVYQLHNGETAIYTWERGDLIWRG